ncbi:hypothetical protein AAE478_001588 [Parahypoxylon ruwenzoriense]
MVSNAVFQPATEVGDEDEISPVSNPASISHERAPAATTGSSRLQEPVNGGVPPLPTRPTGSSIAQAPSTRQQPLPQPYQQYSLPYAPYPYGQPLRVLPPYSRAWTVCKLILTILSTVLSIIILALACVFAGEEGYADFTAWYAIPITVIAILWNGAELITYGVRARKDVKRGIHPGAHVGMHLCFWLASIFAILFTVSLSISVQSTIQHCAEADNDRYSYYSYCDDYYYSNGSYMNDMYLPTLRAMAALFCLSTINHFVLFVFACIDTHKRNLMKPAGIVIPQLPPAGMYYPPIASPGVAPYYQYSVPMPPQQAHFVPQPSATGASAPNGPQTNAPAQNYQSVAGFYAPTPVPAPARTARSEKAVPSTSALAAPAS